MNIKFNFQYYSFDEYSWRDFLEYFFIVEKKVIVMNIYIFRVRSVSVWQFSEKKSKFTVRSVAPVHE
jgi:hypothetical protein